MQLFLLIGQSNMAGRGELTEQDRRSVTEENIFMLDADGHWQPALEPVHYDNPDLAGIGPGLSFAKAVKPYLRGEPIGLIPCAVGGTKIERWIKGGDLYQNAVARTLSCMERGSLKGILWAQGESDSKEISDAKAYPNRLLGFIHDIRQDLHSPRVPFIASKLGSFMDPRSYPYTHMIDEALHEASLTLGSFRLVESSGLTHKGDFLHYDNTSAKQLGQRMAQAWQELASLSE
ncbi:sialate O-acetylesterase [Paenibacillus gansuensis]|uniref:Sialate O-acetylesterase n=1 Tax=Paenibacillus gansuensis TaxID=306542 RepID=A0ABW5P9E6_9BACL